MEKFLDNLNIRTILLIVFTNLVLFFTLIFVYFSLKEKQEEKEVETKIVHEVLDNLKNAKISQRDYALTLDKKFLENYNSSISLVNENLDSLNFEHSEHVDEHEKKILDELSLTVRNKINNLNEIIEHLEKNKNHNEVLDLINHLKETVQLEKIANLVHEYEQIDIHEIEEFGKVTSIAEFLIVLFLLIETFLVLILLITQKKSQEKNKELLIKYELIEKNTKSYSFYYNVKKDEIIHSKNILDIYEVDPKLEISKDLLLSFMDDDSKLKIHDTIQKKLEVVNILKIKTQKGSIKYLEENCFPVLKNDELIFYVSGIDITEKVLLKEKEKEQQMMIMNQQRLAQQGEMLQMIGHQWRQPLSQISLNAQLIEHLVENPDDVVKDKINTIVEVTDYLSKTISDFKHFFSDKKELTQFPVSKVVEESLNVIGNRIDNLKLEIKKDFNTQDIKVYKTELGQVLLAIINNAIDILEEKNIQRCIEISSFEIDEFNLEIKICDNAGGIPQDVLPYIFDPYFSTKKEKNGTGLGLYMSKMIIEDSFGGALKAFNTDIGACFSIVIPKIIYSKEK